MKLTDEQSKMVEENHNLIYWYIHLKGLNLDEWYDQLAIELCITCQKYDETKGSISNYYKLRCDNLVKKQYARTKLQKNANNGISSIETRFDLVSDYNLEDEVILKTFMEGEFKDILRLREKGYTQEEIAKTLGVTQSYISKILRRLRTEYDR